MLQITKSADVFNAIKEYITRPEQEEVFIISLNAGNKVKSIKFAALGDADQVTMPFRYIYQQLCIDSASGAILVHTHPSGNPTPSNSDLRMTEKIKTGLDTLGITLVDHIIVCEDRWYSFTDMQIYKA